MRKKIIIFLLTLFIPVLAYAVNPQAIRIDNTPAGDISATTVQGAINELDSEKLSSESDPLSLHLTNESNDVTGGTFDLTTTGIISAEQLTSTDDANIADHLNVGVGTSDGLITVSAEGNMNYLTLSSNDAGTSDIYSVEQLYLRCADNDFTFMHNLYTGPYFRINVNGTNPLLTSSTGIFDFDNDNITTTGTLASATGLTLGLDAATNTAGYMKLWSAGANDFYSTFTAGTQTANATYTLPTAMAAVANAPLISSTAGVLSWNDQAVKTTSEVIFAKGTIDNIILDGNSITHTASVASDFTIKNTDVSKSVLVNVMSPIGVDFTIGNFNGQYASVAFGLSASSTAVGSIALGQSSNASATGAIAIGNSTISSGASSVAIGSGNTAGTASGAVSIGSKPEKGSCAATGTNSLGLGRSHVASGDGASAIGNTATASATNAVAVGYNLSATNTSSVAVGSGFSNGVASSLALGFGNTAIAITSTLIDMNLNVDISTKNISTDTSTGTKIGTATNQKLGFFNATPIVQPAEITDELTTITHTAPGTPDYALQDLTDSGGFGFVTKDEGNTLLSVVANLQARVNDLENKLSSLGLVADAD